MKKSTFWPFGDGSVAKSRFFLKKRFSQVDSLDFGQKMFPGPDSFSKKVSNRFYRNKKRQNMPDDSNGRINLKIQRNKKIENLEFKKSKFVLIRSM